MKTLTFPRAPAWLATVLLAASPLAAHALSGVTDPAGDFLPTFGGEVTDTDLDVVAATVLYDASTDLFKLSATMAGSIGNDPDHFYVWGVNRGAGVVNAGFAANGIDGVRFDRVVILNQDGTGSVAGVGSLPAGSVTIAGQTITAIVSGSLLVSTGFTQINYTWNIWPRDGEYSGFAAISDFAPDNSNFTSTAGIVTAPVPEPGALAMMLGGLGVLGTLLRRRRT